MIIAVDIIISSCLVLTSIGLLPDLHQTALLLLLPQTQPPFTFFQHIPAIVVDREIFLVSHPRHTRLTRFVGSAVTSSF